MRKNLKFFVWYIKQLLLFAFLAFLVGVWIVMLMGYRAVLYEPNIIIASVELAMLFFLVFTTYQEFVKGIKKQRRKKVKYEQDQGASKTDFT